MQTAKKDKFMEDLARAFTIESILKDKKTRVAIDSYNMHESILSMEPKQWESYMNKARKVHAAMPNYYLAALSGDDKYLFYLRHACSVDLLVSSTRLFFQDRKDTKIVQYSGSEIINPIESEALPIQTLVEPIEKVLKKKKGLKFLQRLFMTNDNPEAIAEAIESLASKKRSDIVIWFPSDYEIGKNKELAAAMYNSAENFIIHLNFPMDCLANAHSVDYLRI